MSDVEVSHYVTNSTANQPMRHQFFNCLGENQAEVSPQINTNVQVTRTTSSCITQSRFRAISQDLSRNRDRERKTIIRMVCILGALFMCNLPALLMFLYTSYYGVGYKTASYFAPWTRTVIFVNTIINPVLYCYRNEHFQKRKSFRRRQKASGTSNSQSCSSCITIH